MAWRLLQAFQIAQEIDWQAAERRKKAEQAELEAKQSQASKECKAPSPSGHVQPIKVIKQYSCIRLKDGREGSAP